MKRLVFSVLLAAVFWFVMFFPFSPFPMGAGERPNFWLMMTCASLTLTTLAIAFGGWPRLAFKMKDNFGAYSGCSMRLEWREFVLGAGIAAVLWGVFWLGDKCSQQLFDFARPQVDLIYGIKSGTSSTLVGLLLLLIIGPGEEFFWRGYVQEHLSKRFSPNVGFLLATAAYTLIHVSSLNFMLVMAALVCGIAWGGLYRLIPNHFTAIIVSHALWDATAFVWFPL